MKLKALVAVVALFSSTAFACPDLAGTYVCESDEGNSQISVAQAVTSGVTVYTVDEGDGPYELIADGVTRTQEGQTQEGNFVSMNLTNTCSGTASLTTVMNYKEVDATGKAVGGFKATQIASRAANGGLAITVKYSENGGAEQVGKGVCAKQ